MPNHTYDTVLTVADTFKVNVGLVLDEYGDLVEWAFTDMSGVDISEDVCHLFMQKGPNKMARLDEILIERAIDKMRDDE